MTHSKKTWYSIFLIVVVVLAVFVIVRSEQGKPILSEYMIYEIHTISFQGKDLPVYLADNPRIRTRGLSNKTSLPEDKGMLFVFEKPDKYSFWMKDMNFSIDMIWIDENGKVVFIKENATPESYPTLFTPEKNALYVLEVNKGWVDEKGVRVGSVFELNF